MCSTTSLRQRQYLQVWWLSRFTWKPARPGTCLHARGACWSAVEGDGELTADAPRLTSADSLTIAQLVERRTVI